MEVKHNLFIVHLVRIKEAKRDITKRLLTNGREKRGREGCTITERERQRDRQTNRRTDRQTDRYTDRETETGGGGGGGGGYNSFPLFCFVFVFLMSQHLCRLHMPLENKYPCIRRQKKKKRRRKKDNTRTLKILCCF